VLNLYFTFYFKAPGAAGKTGSLGKKPGESYIVTAPYRYLSSMLTKPFP